MDGFITWKNILFLVWRISMCIFHLLDCDRYTKFGLLCKVKDHKFRVKYALKHAFKSKVF